MRQRRPLGAWRRGTIAALALFAAAACRAQVGATIGADTDYRYRGVSLSDSRPSAHVAVTYDDPGRWYAGASAISATVGTTNDRDVRLLGYAGWTTPIDAGRHLEFGVDASHFAGASGYDFVEGYAGLLGERWSTRLYFAPDYYGQHVRIVYSELDAHVAIKETGRLFVHVGALLPVAGAHGEADKVRGDITLGAGTALGDWDLHLAWVGATRGGPYPAVFTGRSSAV
ncbi:MAG TPA: TorF family putative porin, partial [Caldimonas sp.]